MLHPSTELRFVNERIGHGVFATELIPAGTIIWAVSELDQLIAPERVAAMPELARRFLNKYAYVDARGLHVLCCDNARFMNHHCEATCRPGGLDFEIAVRDIQPGEQLTDDYGGLNIKESFECGCGSPRCRRVIHPSDPLQYSKIWDAQVKPILPRVPLITQPLWPFVQNDPDIAAIVAGKAGADSMSHYHPSSDTRTPV